MSSCCGGGGGGALSGTRSPAEAIDPLAPQVRSAPTAIADANRFMRIRKSPFSPCHVQSPAIPTRGILMLFFEKPPLRHPPPVWAFCFRPENQEFSRKRVQSSTTAGLGSQAVCQESCRCHVPKGACQKCHICVKVK